MRLDLFLAKAGYFPSRTKAAEAVRAGRVKLDGRPASCADEAGEDSRVEISSEGYRALNGAYKLERALEVFGVDPSGWACADIGASTGGFTSVLLDRGARRVYAVDVGINQLAPEISRDPRVTVLDGVNARSLSPGMFDETPRLAVCDLSFISLRLVLAAVAGCLEAGGGLVALVKPQFEVGKNQVGKGGVVRDFSLHRQAIAGVLEAASAAGLAAEGLTYAPIRARSKNVEYLAYFCKGAAAGISPDGIALAVKEAQSLW